MLDEAEVPAKVRAKVREVVRAAYTACAERETAHIDFETYCELDVRTVGAYRYSEHPSCEVLILCYKLPGKPKQYWLPCDPLGPGYGEPFPKDLADYIASGRTLTAHNAEFEMNIWNNVVVKKYSGPTVKDEQWRCTAARAAACGLPRSLEKAAIALHLRSRKDKEGTRLINVFCKPRKPTKLDKSTRVYPWKRPDEFRRFISYCGTDVDTEEELDTRLPDLGEYEWSVYLQTMRMNRWGIPLDLKSVRSGQKVLTELEKNVVARTVELTGGIRPTQRDKMLAFFKEIEGLGDLENLQAKTVKDLVTLRGSELDPQVQELLLLRIEGGKASTKKLKKMLVVVCEDGTVKGGFLYWGASTGRLAGKLIQPQNFTRGEYTPAQLYKLFELLALEDPEVFKILYEWPIDALAQGMRGYIHARPGRKFVVCDFAAIEARVLAWLARATDTMALFAQNVDLYKRLAVILYHLKSVDEVTTPQRKFAKDLFLGSGYQLGWKGFITNCLKRGIVVSEEEAQRAIKVYRDDNPEVVKLWYDVERCAVKAVDTGATRTNPVKLRNLSFFVEDIWFCIKLPSGRLLRYPYPKVEYGLRFGKPTKKLTYRSEIKGKWLREGTYGGKLVENIVQAIARDLMVFSCFQAEKRGYPLCGTVHDELITEPEENFGSHKELELIMRKKPAWATDAPIGAEGWEGKRYRK